MAQPTHNEQPDLFDLGLQAGLAMLSQSPVERRRLLSLGALGKGIGRGGGL